MICGYTEDQIKRGVHNKTTGRPAFEDIKTGAEFFRWYWMKDELADICKRMGLPSTGRKFELRDRIMYALDHDGKLKPSASQAKPTSKFNWAKAELTVDTVITDNVSFGQNFRRFMKSQVGDKFSFNTYFMDWAKANPGKTLGDAVEEWKRIEAQKKDPAFKTKIADNNMYNQYTRDFMEDNPGASIAKVRSCWLLKKQVPSKDGFVRYHRSDLKLPD